MTSETDEAGPACDAARRAEDFAAVGEACAVFNVRRAARTLTRLYARAFEPLGLEPTQFTLLVACSRQDAATTTALAARLQMDPSALARNVAVLERRGLLAVCTGDMDGRTRSISLTEAGKATLADALPRWKAVQRQLAGQMGHDRLVCTIDLVKAMAAAGETLLNTSDD